MQEEEQPGIEVPTGGTPPTASQDGTGTDPQPTPPAPEKTFTQNEVNDLIRARLEKANASLAKKYGVKDLNELDNLVSQAQSYGVMREREEARKNELAQAKRDLVYLKSGIDESRYGDVEAYFRGKGLEFTEDTLARELTAHPEWLRQPAQGRITALGADKGGTPPQESEEEKAAKMLGFDKFL